MPAHSMMATVDGQRSPVTGWQLCCVAPDSVTTPQAIAQAPLEWLDAGAAGTAAAALRSLQRWSLDDPPRRFDAEDWWFRARFKSPSRTAPAGGNEQVVLGFDGLATLAQVWLNGELLLESDNMFVAHQCRVETKLRDDNEILIRCAALDTRLARKRPRPKWRVPMLENQQLRWIRTTLLGRTPGWSAPCAPVGPWRPVWLETRSNVSLSDLRLNVRVDDGAGRVEVSCVLTAVGSARIRGVALQVTRNGTQHSVALAAPASTDRYAATLAIPDVALWYPHTHGEPALYDATLVVDIDGSAERRSIPLRRIGFRTLSLSTEGGDFRLSVNGIDVFCRGACWTPIDPVSLRASGAPLLAALEQVRAAGMNMLRVSGTLIYESDDFLDGCDSLGILLWQEFMFASMDYPEGDAAFDASVRVEATQQLGRLVARPSLAVICGNSEVEQQAAMWGVAREHWSPALFHQTLAAMTAEHCADVPYWPSSAHGGAFPHQASTGTTSYYGVGAYLRPLDDARRAELRFATECLAFANVPANRTLERIPTIGALRCHHAAWKARSPRDLGAGWDFDDVRDHYLALLFAVNPLQLRYSDHARYLALSRVVSGELMAASFSEWRRARSSCRGALIWFLRDSWPGAGWGIVDALGAPKAAYHYLRRTLQPVAVFMTDEGGNGLCTHVVNETATSLSVTLELTLYRDGQVVVYRQAKALAIAARGSLELAAGEFFEGFVDTSYAYRFGPPPHDLAVASLRDARGNRLGEAFHLIGGLARAPEANLGMSAQAAPRSDGGFDLTVRAVRFAQAVHLDAEGFEADDDYFHLAPGASHTCVVRATPGGAGTTLRGSVHAINAQAPVRIGVVP